MWYWYSTFGRTYDDDEADELFEEGLIDECGNWINYSTIIGLHRRR